MSPWGVLLPVICPLCRSRLAKIGDGYECSWAGPEHWRVSGDAVDELDRVLNEEGAISPHQLKLTVSVS